MNNSEIRVFVNPTQGGIIERDSERMIVGIFAWPLDADSAFRLGVLARKWKIAGPNGPVRSIEIEPPTGVSVDDVWSAYHRAMDAAARGASVTA